LHLDTPAIPTQQSVYRKGVTKTVNRRAATVGSADSRSVEELPHREAEAASAVAVCVLGTVPDQLAGLADRLTECATDRKITLHFSSGIGRERQLPGLVELRCPYTEETLLGLIILNFEAKEFTKT
jgi:hypothetical protein